MRRSTADGFIALADDLDRLANDAANLHADLRDGGNVWGTGVTEGIERKLAEQASSLRGLVRAAHDDGRVA